MKLIRLSKSSITQKDKIEVQKVLDKEFLGMGEEVKKFENLLSKYFKSYVACVSSGTTALQLALQAIGIKKNDEVLIPALTYVAAFQAITALGAKPISLDIKEDDLNFDEKDIEKKITKKTKCIMPVHYSGSPGNLDKLFKLRKKYNLRVIEDAAHAFGSKYKNKLIGSFGDIICFSFDGIKNITSGEGGCVVSKNKKIIDYVKDARTLGINKETSSRYKNKRNFGYKVKIQGWRYHMSNINAGLGISQFNRKEKIFKKRKKFANLYVQYLKRNKSINLLKHDYKNIVPHIFVIKIKNFNYIIRNDLRKFMQQKNIETGIHWLPCNKLDYFKNFSKQKLVKTDKLSNKILTLPLHLDLDETQIKYICHQLDQGINKLRKLTLI